MLGEIGSRWAVAESPVGEHGSLVSGAGQVYYVDGHYRRCGVGWLVPPAAMSDGANALLSISRQDAPGVSRADTHQRGCLVQRHVISEQAVQDLDSRLFFWR